MIKTTGEVANGPFKVFAFPNRAAMHLYEYMTTVLSDIPPEYYIIRYKAFGALVDDILGITKSAVSSVHLLS